MSSEHEFEQFVRTHALELLRTAVLISGSRDSGEELLQETLARLYPKWGQVAAAEFPLAYVRRSLANQYVSGRRSPATRGIPVWDVPDRSDGIDVAETIATSQAVWLLLEDLSKRQRVSVVLRYFYGLSDVEIAEILGCRAATVRSLVHRAIAALRRELEDESSMTKAGS